MRASTNKAFPFGTEWTNNRVGKVTNWLDASAPAHPLPAVNNGTSNGATESFFSEVNGRKRYNDWLGAVVRDRGALIVLLVPYLRICTKPATFHHLTKIFFLPPQYHISSQ